MRRILINRAQAINFMETQFGRFRYVYKKVNLGVAHWHFTFNIVKGLPQIQMSIKFYEEFTDILAFPHPVIVNGENYMELLRIINYINWNIKGLGRFYIDDNMDIAYSLRIKYEMLDYMGNLCLQEIEFIVEVYTDIIKILFDISKHNINYEQGKREIDFIWHELL